MKQTRWIRKPAAAGRFYPAAPVELEQAIRSYLEQAGAEQAAEDQAGETPDCPVRGLIVPHAGYPCSGAVAAHAYRTLLGWGMPRPPVYLMGPAHWLPVPGVGLSSADSFLTPLGLAPVMRRRVAHLLKMGGQYVVADTAHRPEHCLEVQLPFLQVVLGRFQIVPLLFGWGAGPAQVADDLSELLQEEPGLLIASSDLSHGLPYVQAMEADRGLLAAVVAGDLAGASRGEACGLLPILTLMQVARRYGWTPHLLDYRTSGDTCSGKASVIGYGALVYRERSGPA